MNPRSDRPEEPGVYSHQARAAHGTGVMFGQVQRVHTVRGRRRFDVRTEGGEIYPSCEAVLGGPSDGQSWVGARVAVALTDSGRVIVLGPTGDAGGNPKLERETPAHDSAQDHPGQFGPGDRVIEHNGIRLVFGERPNDLLIEVPGVLRIQASALRFSKGGATGERVVMWGPFLDWAATMTERVNAHDSWIESYQTQRTAGAGSMLAPEPLPPVIPAAVEAPTNAMASGTITIPEEGL